MPATLQAAPVPALSKETMSAVTTQTTAKIKEPLFSFPHPVNEYAARFVATGVVIWTVSTILLTQYVDTDFKWLMIPLAYGFIARVLTGPKLSPLGLFVTKWLIPNVVKKDRPVAGPPKRFAQGMGVGFTVIAAALALGFGQFGASFIVLGMLAAAASLEAFLNYCLGCKIFGILMKTGIIPASVCAECADFEARNKSVAVTGGG